jgi:Ni,Fe-hydrogenase III small subunit
VNVLWRALPNLVRAGRSGGQRRRFRVRPSLFIRHVDGGSSNIAEAEMMSLMGPVYNLAGYGVRVVASPCHANALLITGPLTRNMLGPLRAAFAVMPEPRYIVTVGDGAAVDGLTPMARAFDRSYATTRLPPDMAAAVVAHVAGDPPEPENIIEALIGVAKMRGRRR